MINRPVMIVLTGVVIMGLCARLAGAQEQVVAPGPEDKLLKHVREHRHFKVPHKLSRAPFIERCTLMYEAWSYVQTHPSPMPYDDEKALERAQLWIVILKSKSVFNSLLEFRGGEDDKFKRDRLTKLIGFIESANPIGRVPPYP